jgi:hypothetical protein
MRWLASCAKLIYPVIGQPSINISAWARSCEAEGRPPRSRRAAQARGSKKLNLSYLSQQIRNAEADARADDCLNDAEREIGNIQIRK